MVLGGERSTAIWPAVDGVFGEFLVDDADVDEAFTLWREAWKGQPWSLPGHLALRHAPYRALGRAGRTRVRRKSRKSSGRLYAAK